MPHKYRMQKKRIGERTFIRQDICWRYWFRYRYTMCVFDAVTMVILWYGNDDPRDNWIVERNENNDKASGFIVKKTVFLAHFIYKKHS